MSVDYPISQRAFIMNLCPLWTCVGDKPVHFYIRFSIRFPVFIYKT